MRYKQYIALSTNLRFLYVELLLWILCRSREYRNMVVVKIGVWYYQEEVILVAQNLLLLYTFETKAWQQVFAKISS